jgi:hypothetical protein
VDGEVAGQLAFQVVVSAKPGDLVKERAVPSASEIYNHATSSAVQIEKLDDKGRVLRNGSGFLAMDGTVVTSFRTIEGATSLRLRLADGKSLAAPGIVAWNRRQDWAILATDFNSNTSLKVAEGKTWNIGDHCYWLDIKTDGSRILSEGQIVGMQSPQDWGERISVSGVYGSGASGGALINDYGEVIGILGGVLPESFLSGFSSQADSELIYATTGGTSVAASMLPKTVPASRSTLQDLWTKGQMMPPITNSKYILFGMLSHGEKTKGKKFQPGERDQKVTFQRSDASASALLHFANSENFKSTAVVKLYDVDNRTLASGKTEKLNVTRGEVAERMWQLPLSNLSPGIYRVDVEVGDGVAWRQFFKLTD